MALTLDYMRQLVRSRLDDEDFEEEFLDQALNEAQWDLLRNKNLSFMEKSAPVTLTAGTNTTSYPSDISSLIGVRAIASGTASYNLTDYYLDYATFQELQLPTVGQATTPLRWTSFAGNMIFPANADKDYTITVDYYKLAPKVDGTTVNTFVIPDQYQELLKIGAYMRIAKREDDYDVKQQEMLDYDRMRTDMLKSYSASLAPRRQHRMRVMGR